MAKNLIPVLPLRDIVVFPNMVAPLFVGREQSVNALNHVMTGDKKIFLLSQKNSKIDNPNKDNLYYYKFLRIKLSFSAMDLISLTYSIYV